MTKSVEVLAAYSHSAQATDLQLCRTAALTSPVRAPKPSAKRPWSLRDRLDERDIADLITAYRDGATAASLATTQGLSLRLGGMVLSCAPSLRWAMVVAVLVVMIGGCAASPAGNRQ